MKKGLVFIAIFIMFLLFQINVNEMRVQAYNDVCVEKANVYSISGNYLYKCDNKAILLLDEENKSISSLFFASKEVFSDKQILYAGVIDGVDTFYTRGFFFYDVVYDGSVFSEIKSAWSDISINGVMFSSGKFKDNVLVDQSYQRYLPYFDEKGSYLIRQYVNKELVNHVRIVVVGKENTDLLVSTKMGGEILNNQDIVYSNQDLSLDFFGTNFGLDETVVVKINENEIVGNITQNYVKFANDIIGKYLNLNEINTVEIIVKDGIGRKKIFTRRFKIVGEKVSIKLESSVETPVTTSRRIVIVANPGKDNNLDSNYNLYYWSENADDALTYEDFMKNYEASSNKGVYSGDKGVILRDSSGIYYLYALARDDESAVVVRSNQYVLEKSGQINKVVPKDIFLIIGLCIAAAVPVLIYIVIRGKDTE